MASLNIPSTKDDPNYRYKMPKLVAKVEGRGNGIKTNIVNMGDIARALKRPPDYVTKFFALELGALSKFEAKEEKAIVNGAHEPSDLQKLVDKFIEMYVLCPTCSLPEMDLTAKKKVGGKCNACGSQAMLDNVHRLATYIIKNPPGGSDSTMGKKKEKKAESSDEEKKKAKKPSDGKKEKKEKKSKSKDANVSATPTNATNGVDVTADDGGPTASGDSSDGKDKKKKKKSKDGGSSQLLKDDEIGFDSSEIGEALEKLKAKLAANPSMDASTFRDEVRNIQLSQKFDSKIRFYLVLRTLFDDSTFNANKLAEQMSHLSVMIDKSATGSDLLSALIHFVYHLHPASITDYPNILCKFYQSDVLEEGVILKFYRKNSKSDEAFEATCKAAEPFLAWLEQSDDGEADSDDEEDVPTREYKSLNLGSEEEAVPVQKSIPVETVPVPVVPKGPVDIDSI